MAKAFGVHEVELNPGVTAEDYENALAQLSQPMTFPGVKVYFLKGDRGERNGKYLTLWEFESVERRNQLFPNPNEYSAEVQRWIEAHGTLFGQLGSLSTSRWTDYSEAGR